MFLVQFLWLVCCTCLSFHSRACGKSVWESDPCKTLHLGDIPGHQRMQIFVSTKSQVHVRQVGRQLICLILNLGLLHWLLVVLVRSAHHYKQCSEVQLLNRVIRCGVGWWNSHVYISLRDLCWRTPHTHFDGLSLNDQSYLNFDPSLNSRLFKLKPISEIGITVNQVEARFSETNSSICFDLCDVDILMTSAFSLMASFLSFRAICFSDCILESSGSLCLWLNLFHQWGCYLCWRCIFYGGFLARICDSKAALSHW